MSAVVFGGSFKFCVSQIKEGIPPQEFFNLLSIIIESIKGDKLGNGIVVMLKIFENPNLINSVSVFVSF